MISEKDYKRMTDRRMASQGDYGEDGATFYTAMVRKSRISLKDTTEYTDIAFAVAVNPSNAIRYITDTIWPQDFYTTSSKTEVLNLFPIDVGSYLAGPEKPAEKRIRSRSRVAPVKVEDAPRRLRVRNRSR